MKVKYLFLSLMLLLGTAQGLAATTRTVTFDFVNNYASMGLNSDSTTMLTNFKILTYPLTESNVITIDGVQVTPPSGKDMCYLMRNKSSYDTNGTSVRLCVKDPITVGPVSPNEVITGIKLKYIYTNNGTKKYVTIPNALFNGTLTYTAGTIVSWTGSEKQVTVGSADGYALKFGQMEVTLQEVERPEAPVISPAGGSFAGSQQVTITAPEGCTVRYTTDGTEPTATTGTVYEAPFTITESCTVKAVSVNADGVASLVASADFTKLAPQYIDSTACFAAIADGATVTFDCPLTAVYQSDDRAYTYVTDTYQRHNVLLWCPDGLPVTLARDEELRAGVSGLKTTQGELTVLQVDAATVARVTAIQAQKIVDGDIISFQVNDFVMSLGCTIAAESSTTQQAPALRSVRRKADASQSAATTYSVDGGAYRMVNKFGVTVLEGDARKFLGVIGMEGGEKVVYPTLVTLPTATDDVAAAPTATVTTTPGCISVTGQWTTIAVFNAAGQLIATNQPTVHCPAGTYVVLLDGHPHKVAVR